MALSLPSTTVLFFESPFFLKTYLFNFCLCWLFIAAPGLSLVVVNRGYSPVAVFGLLIKVAFLVVEPGL